MSSIRNLPKKKATLKDVARTANVSIATVSRVLNNSPSVTKKTKDHVNDVIQKLSFSPSPMARALNSGRTRTVGALVPTLDHAIFSKFLEALEKRLSDHKHSLVISTTNGSPKTEFEQATALLNMGAEALIVSGKQRSLEFDALVKRFNVPVIITSYYDPNADYPSIGYDNAAISKLALNHFIEKQYNTVAVIHGPTTDNDRTRDRLEGIKSDNRFSDVNYMEVALSIDGGCQATRRIISSGQRPDVIFCLSDVLALGVLFELQRNNISIPNDVAVMGFDNLEWAEHTVPPLTSIELSVKDMGKHAADEVCSFLNTGKPIDSVKLSGHLLKRETT
ncbi:LacI family DNA-binding transcriptional regulator [Amylibacter sp. SFDW26]|uniref:LacI family DNA-binding transcriptional regulator n=1 Tax=Amylibacter sp. SFDW26 TaxID=2652722 RepID=UPI00186A4668|nr:LacI family DNA-binding transcriptional regulator [Amylibacter sp. SFDW26]